MVALFLPGHRSPSDGFTPTPLARSDDSTVDSFDDEEENNDEDAREDYVVIQGARKAAIVLRFSISIVTVGGE